MQADHTIAVHIPAGAPEGYEEVFSGEADESPDFEPGDVIVRVRSKLNSGKGWTRKEGGLVGRVTLSVAEVSLSCVASICQLLITFNSHPQALLGFERNLTSLDGRTIAVRRDGTTQPGEVEVIEGEGVS